jgi:geranylgeranyl reductase family protein
MISVDYDVIVIGAGPGGSTAARYCSKSGLKTLLIEKDRHPRYKPCGGCLSLKTINQLHLDITHLIENTIYGAKFSYCFKDPFIIKSKDPIAFLVMRDRFDQFLTHKALENGSEILEGIKVIGIEEEEKRVCVYLQDGRRLHSEYLIGADGAESIVAKSILTNKERIFTNGMAIESEIPFNDSIHFPKEEFQLVHLDFGLIPNGYGWVFPKKSFLSIGIGGMFKDTNKLKTRKYFSAFIAGLEWLPKGKVERSIGHSLPTFYNEHQKVSKGRILLVGDAANLMDPLQGEGIYYTIYSGILAAQAILYSKEKGISPSEIYQDTIENKVLKNFKWALSLSRFVYRFTKLSYKTLKAYPELGQFYINVLEGKETYFDFTRKVKERVKDLLGGRLSKKIREAMAKT